MPAQKYEQAGNQKVVNYSPSQLNKLAPQNWCITSNNKGEIFVGNNKNLLHFNGEFWKEIKVQEDFRVESVYESRAIIYIGGYNEFGYLWLDCNGSYRYKSLRPENQKEFGAIISISERGDEIIFKNYYHTFVYKLKDNLVHKFSNKIFSSQLYAVDSLLLGVSSDNKLISYQGKVGYKKFAEIPGVNDVVGISFYENSIWVAMDHEFVHNYDLLGNLVQSISLPKELKGVVVTYFLSHDNKFYLATKNGLYITDNKFRVLDRINQDNGLRDNNITSLHLDNRENLWMTLNNGLAHINIGQSIRSYENVGGLTGLVEDIAFTTSRINVATHSGVFCKTKDRFNQVQGTQIRNQAWNLHSFSINNQEKLLSISNAGVHEVFQNGTSKLLLEGYAYRLHQSTLTPTRVYIGMEDGLMSINYQNGKWINEGYLLKTNYTAYNLYMKDSVMHIGDDPNGHYTKLTLQETTSTRTISTQITYDTSNGLPLGMIIPLGEFIGTNEGIYTETSPGVFKPYLKFNRLFTNKDPYVHRLSKDPMGNLWAVVQWQDTIEGQAREVQELGYFKFSSISGWSWITGPFSGLKKGKIDAIFHQDSNITWLGGTDGLFRFDKRQVKTRHHDYYTSITKVFSLNDKELLFGGNFVDSSGNWLEEQASFLELPYLQNRLEFEFAAREYEDQEVLYSFYLKGYEENYSDFERKTSAIYKNLPEGNYTFYVKAKNRFGIVSEAPTYSFTILPPWYRTWWAYALYVLLALFIGFAVLWVWTSNLRTQVQNKTKEVVQQKEIIEEKNHDIMQSIAYAEKIQQSILPSSHFLNSHLRGGFVLFKPRDVVSGDFYWATAKENEVYFSVMDCTGHGVPGAFMSMIGNRGLNEIVNDKGFTDCGIILTALRENIVGALSQDGTTANRDGMDGALCKFNKDTLSLEFSGGNNGVFVLRNIEDPLLEESGMQLEAHKYSTLAHKVYELKPQKMPIGYYPEKDDAFASSTYQLQKGDVLYLTTDGYVDQFGGEKGKKLKKANFIKKLIELQGVSMDGQKEDLWAFMQKWMGEHEQIDDICVMGVLV